MFYIRGKSCTNRRELIQLAMALSSEMSEFYVICGKLLNMKSQYGNLLKKNSQDVQRVNQIIAEETYTIIKTRSTIGA